MGSGRLLLPRSKTDAAREGAPYKASFGVGHLGGEIMWKPIAQLRNRSSSFLTFTCVLLLASISVGCITVNPTPARSPQPTVSAQQDLILVANGSSCLRVVNGIFGMGKSFTLRVLQEYAHKEEFATSFLTLSSRECPMDNLKSMYRHIIKGFRTAGCIDRPALEDVLESWALEVKEYVARHSLAPWAVSDLV